MYVDAPSPEGGVDVMQVEAIQPLSEIRSERAAVGATIPVPLDLQEMGIPNVGGVVQSITACPPIQSGPGRVVLTTVTHLSDDIYTLTLTNAAGQSDSLQPTGYHRFYTLDRGWVTTDQLRIGEQIRGDNGDVTVTADIAETGVQRVYNMTVQDDHDYYVGSLEALTHNDCPVTYQTYTKTNADTGEVYTGRTSGTGTPDENVAARDVDHHMTDQGFGPAQLDKSSSNYDAIRGREQDMIWQNGGAQTEGGTSGNVYNGIGPDNPNMQKYLDASNQEFGYGNGSGDTGADGNGDGE